MSRVVLYDSTGKVVLSLELKVGVEKELARLLSALGTQAPEAKVGAGEGSKTELNRSSAAEMTRLEPFSASFAPQSQVGEAAHLAAAEPSPPTEPPLACLKEGSISPTLSVSLAPSGSNPGANSGSGAVTAAASLPSETSSNTPAEASPTFGRDEHLEHLDRARAFIFRGASHEIRGALNIQTLLLDLLQTRLQRLGVPKKELEPSCAKIAAQVPRIVQKMDWLANLNPDGKALNSLEVTFEELLQSIWAFAQKMAQPRGVDVELQIASGLVGPAPSSRLADALILLFSALIELVQDVELTVVLQAASANAPLLMHRSWPRQAAMSEGEEGTGSGLELSLSPTNQQVSSEFQARSFGEGSEPGLNGPVNCVPPIFELQILGSPFRSGDRLEVALCAFERLGSRWKLDDRGLVLWL